MKKRLLITISYLFFILSIANASALFIGLTDGYIKNMTGGTISGAVVTVTVSGCSGGVSNGCSGSDTTDANGYYIINNLNLPKSGTVIITATEGIGSGSNSGTADDSQVAHVNATICYPPSAPVISIIQNSHNTTANFNWTSGTDPKGFETHDEFGLDGAITNPAISPIIRTGLSFSTHNWNVSTCNSMCCGTNSSSFTLLNSAPSAPNNTNASVNDAITSLIWNSGIDPDGDATYDELQYQNGTIISSSATSPYDVPTELLIKWRVRTCDGYACSNWTEVDSVTCTAISTTCPECVCTGGGGGGSVGISAGERAAIEARYLGAKKVEIYCNGFHISNESLLRINLNLGKRNKISLFGINLSLENLEYCPWCYNGIKDYDEDGVDCGGSSCRACTEAEMPEKIAEMRYVTMVIVSLIIIGGIVYFLEAKGILKDVIRKIFLRYKYYGI